MYLHTENPELILQKWGVKLQNIENISLTDVYFAIKISFLIGVRPLRKNGFHC